MARVVAEGRVGDTVWGPRWGVRWWRLTAGVSLGLACAVKWNGVYYIAAFGLLCVLWDVSVRRRAGVARPWVGTMVRDVAPALWALVLIPVLTYIGSWWAWFGSETGRFFRFSSDARNASRNASVPGCAFFSASGIARCSIWPASHA